MPGMHYFRIWAENDRPESSAVGWTAAYRTRRVNRYVRVADHTARLQVLQVLEHDEEPVENASAVAVVHSL